MIWLDTVVTAEFCAVVIAVLVVIEISFNWWEK